MQPPHDKKKPPRPAPPPRRGPETATVSEILAALPPHLRHLGDRVRALLRGGGRVVRLDELHGQIRHRRAAARERLAMLPPPAGTIDEKRRARERAAHLVEAAVHLARKGLPQAREAQDEAEALRAKAAGYGAEERAHRERQALEPEVRDLAVLEALIDPCGTLRRVLDARARLARKLARRNNPWAGNR